MSALVFSLRFQDKWEHNLQKFNDCIELLSKGEQPFWLRGENPQNRPVGTPVLMMESGHVDIKKFIVGKIVGKVVGEEFSNVIKIDFASTVLTNRLREILPEHSEEINFRTLFPQLGGSYIEGDEINKIIHCLKTGIKVA